MPQLHTALGFWRSKEGEREYAKLGLNYDTYQTVHDAIYSTDFLVNYRKSKDPADSTWFSNVARVQSSFDLNPNPNPNSKNGKKESKPPHKREYLTYSIYETRLDAAGNRKRFYRSNIGVYPIPHVSWKLVRNPETGLVNYSEEGEPERVIDRITNVTKGYSIPFSKSTLQKWVSDGLIILNEENRQTHFSIRKDGERETITVKSLDDLINKSFDKLYEDGWAAYHNFMHHNVPVTSTTTEVQQQQQQTQAQ